MTSWPKLIAYIYNRILFLGAAKHIYFSYNFDVYNCKIILYKTRKDVINGDIKYGKLLASNFTPNQHKLNYGYIYIFTSIYKFLKLIIFN